MNRQHERQKDDHYTTPAWCVQALLGATDLRGDCALDPAAGNGGIGTVYLDRFPRCALAEIEIDAERAQRVNAPYGTQRRCVQGTFLDIKPDTLPRFDVIITNPPYSQAFEFLVHARECAGDKTKIAFLLRLGFLASQRRVAVLSTWAPDVYVLARRPSFAHGRTDSTDYAWFVWEGTQARSEGKVRVLPP